VRSRRGARVRRGDRNPEPGHRERPQPVLVEPRLFARRFNCGGDATQVRRTNTGVYEVRFPGNGAATAVASGGVGFTASVSPVAGGAWQIALYVIGRNDPADVPFMVVAV
jgi:hypothetical protein